MKKISLILTALALTLSAGSVDTNAVLGSMVGAGVGSAVGSATGGKTGAIIGGGAGGAIGAAIGSNQTQKESTRVVYVDSDDHHHHHDNGKHKGHYKNKHHD